MGYQEEIKGDTGSVGSTQHTQSTQRSQSTATMKGLTKKKLSQPLILKRVIYNALFKNSTNLSMSVS